MNFAFFFAFDRFFVVAKQFKSILIENQHLLYTESDAKFSMNALCVCFIIIESWTLFSVRFSCPPETYTQQKTKNKNQEQF